MRETLLAALIVVFGAGVAGAQPGVPPASTSPSAVAEVHAGRASFIDDGPNHHVVAGGAFRWRITPRITLGPEVTWMRGPGTDRDVFVQGALTWDLLDSRGPRSVTPYLVVAGGVMAHSSGFGQGTWSSEPAVTGGAGVRVDLSPRFFIAPEARIGWEPHVRLTVAGGWRF